MRHNDPVDDSKRSKKENHSRVGDFDEFVQFKTPRISQLECEVNACKNNFVSKEALEIDKKCTQDFNAWYWAQQELKEGKKYVSKAIPTCER